MYPVILLLIFSKIHHFTALQYEVLNLTHGYAENLAYLSFICLFLPASGYIYAGSKGMNATSNTK